MHSEAVSIIAKALGVSEESITAETSLMTTTEWDSLAHFRIVLSLEERLGRPLNPVEITTLIDFSAVQTLLDHA
ncbi:acyl carrier protein [Yoonia sp. R78084]|uniref:acyl carrier protein n=1 Tax=Yoonia sp. R78084 TaxID=3093869 RepID=UPI0037DCFDAF